MSSSARSIGMFSWMILLLSFIYSPAAIVAVSEQNFLPLREGDEWIMDVKIVSPTGEVSKASGKRMVLQKVEHDGKTYYRTRTVLEGGPVPFDYTKLARKDETGFYTIDEREKDQAEKMEIKLPLTVGQTWERSYGPSTVEERVVAKESVTVGDKTYENCFHIRSALKGGGYVEDFWEAPEIGNVKSEMSFGNGMRITLTLREFKPGKPLKPGKASLSQQTRGAAADYLAGWSRRFRSVGTDWYRLIRVPVFPSMRMGIGLSTSATLTFCSS